MRNEELRYRLAAIYLIFCFVSSILRYRLNFFGGIDMCVGLSAKVVSVNEGTAVIDASGAKREVSADLIDDLEVGDYVMVHAGVAIAKITSDDSEETDEIMESIQ